MIEPVPVGRMIGALRRLRKVCPSAVLVKNSIGNLAVLDGRGVYIGWIDCGDGTLTVLPEDQRRGSANGR